jgi:hypothetical protein
MAVAPWDAEARHGPEEGMHGARLGAEEVPCRVVCGRSLGHLIVRAWLDRVYEIGELDRILDEEDGDVVSDNVEVAFVGVAGRVCVSPRSQYGDRSNTTYKRVAKPWTSLAVSALPREPATVEKRTNTGVFFPSSLRKEADVRLLKSP